MKNKFILQSTGFKTSYLEEVARTLNRLNIEWHDFGVIPSENIITNLENILSPNTKFIARGGTKFLSLLETNKDLELLNPNLTKEQIEIKDLYLKKLINSIDYDVERFDQEYYSKLGLPLLNSDAQYIKLEKLLYYTMENDHFVKPSKDLKAFNGGIIYSDETLMNYLMRTPHMNIDTIKEETVVLAPVQKIYSEYRFFMYKNNILGSSRYMLNGEVIPDVNVPEYMKEAAIEYAKLYIPNDLYVIDLGDTDNGVKIVEYNCWNASGFYHCDIQNIIGQVNDIKS
jgi:hypothetical protein